MNYERTKRINRVFLSDKMRKLAQEVVDRIDFSMKELSDALVQALDATVIWNEDKWAVIAYYSLPEEPLPYDKAACRFLEDLTNVI